MVNVRFLEFLFLFGIYFRVKTDNVQVTNLTIKVQSLKLNQVKYEYSLFKKSHDYKLKFGPNIQSDKLDRLIFFKIPSIRRKTRQIHDTLHSLVSSTHPILGRITSSLPLYLKGTLNNVISSSPNSYVPLKDLQILDSNKNNKMYKSMSNNLLLQNRKVKFHQTTTPRYSTAHSGLAQLLDKSVTLTTVRNTIVRSQIKNNTINEKSSYQENEDLLLFDNFSKSLEQFERLLYQVTFNKLLSVSPEDRHENGISFIQSALFLYLALMAISTEVDQSTKVEIENCLNYEGSKMNKMKILRHIISWLPNSNRNMKFRWTSRLVLSSELPVSQEFVEDTATVRLHVTRLNDTKPAVISNTLNRMIEIDSGGALHNTFEEDDMLNEICSILFTTMYIRPRWRSAPTVLNGTRVFYDTNESPTRSVRMIRINDVMQYAALDEWNSDVRNYQYMAFI
ncbi:unnamed protein product [Euphydryas editha]|uniref:Uncharacterized protein n=1 Tax=Euphydryas editha TaxID=104508 RepID=A0AAU9UQB5_EUPED|nr:unnamed protein product [Euphydryas editha]